MLRNRGVLRETTLGRKPWYSSAGRRARPVGRERRLQTWSRMMLPMRVESQPTWLWRRMSWRKVEGLPPFSRKCAMSCLMVAARRSRRSWRLGRLVPAISIFRMTSVFCFRERRHWTRRISVAVSRRIPRAFMCWRRLVKAARSCW